MIESIGVHDVVELAGVLLIAWLVFLASVRIADRVFKGGLEVLPLLLIFGMAAAVAWIAFWGYFL